MFRLKLIFLITLSFFILLFNTGCADLASMNSHSKISRFQNSENVYRMAIRWAEWNDLFHLMKDRPDSLNKLKQPSEYYLLHLETIKVKQVDLLGSNMDKKLGTGSSQFNIGYHTDSSLKINSVRHIVHWWYHKKSNIWFTDTPLPKEFAPPKLRTIKLSPPRRY